MEIQRNDQSRVLELERCPLYLKEKSWQNILNKVLFMGRRVLLKNEESILNILMPVPLCICTCSLHVCAHVYFEDGDYKMTIVTMFSYPHTFLLATLSEMLTTSCPSGFSLVVTYLGNIFLSLLNFTDSTRHFFYIFL